MTKNITGHTVLTGLLGRPVTHSISPMMHNEAFRKQNLDYVYLAFDVGTKELKAAMEGLKALGARGFNLTMPDKNLAAEYLDHVSSASQLIGAVNTVVNDNGILTGHTTDGIGYMRSAIDAGFHLPGKNMTLLGGGGAATSICVQAALDGMKEIHVFNIRDTFFARLQSLVDNINKKTRCRVSLHDLADTSELRRAIQNSHILTNATSVGMSPKEDQCIIEDSDLFRPGLIVSDVIYNPKETKLLKIARQQGCPTFNGMYMLLYQGAEAFRLWTGKDMPVDHIKNMYF